MKWCAENKIGTGCQRFSRISRAGRNCIDGPDASDPWK
jgi:hypothetical protein